MPQQLPNNPDPATSWTVTAEPHPHSKSALPLIRRQPSLSRQARENLGTLPHAHWSGLAPRGTPSE